MRSTEGLDGRSASGVWVIRSGDRLVGPFNGYSPARALAGEMRRAGFDAHMTPLWSPAEIRAYIRTPRPIAPPIEAPGDEWPDPTDAGH